MNDGKLTRRQFQWAVLVSCVLYALALGRLFGEIENYLAQVSSVPLGSSGVSTGVGIFGVLAWLVVSTALIFAAKFNSERVGFTAIVVSTLLLLVRDLVHIPALAFLSIQIGLCLVAVVCLAVSIGFDFDMANRESP